MTDAYADLAPIGAAIGDAQVVALGEPLHAVGNIDAYNARVVTYLHQRLGFTVLAWEAGLWSCESDPSTCPGGPWDDTVETRSLRAPDRPADLKVTGFDIQFTGRGGRERLRDELVRFLGSGAPDLGQRVFSVFARLPKDAYFRAMSAAERETDRAVLEEALGTLRRGPADPSRTRAMRGLENTVSLYDWHRDVHADVSTKMDWGHHTELNNVRDEQMARNIIWLLRDRYRGQKIIVWSANMHIARNVAEIGDLRGAEYQGALTRYRTMGTILREQLGTRFFSIADTAFGGEFGRLPAIPLQAIEPAAAGSIEAVSQTASSPAFVLLAKQGGAARKGRFLGLTDFDAPWAHIFDGAIVFHAVTPATSEATASSDAGATPGAPAAPH